MKISNSQKRIRKRPFSIKSMYYGMNNGPQVPTAGSKPCK